MSENEAIKGYTGCHTSKRKEKLYEKDTVQWPQVRLIFCILTARSSRLSSLERFARSGPVISFIGRSLTSSLGVKFTEYLPVMALSWKRLD